MDDGGIFGSWSEDDDGLPCFDLAIENATRSAGAVLPQGDALRLWHQVGNDHVTATAHAGGWTTLYAAEGGFVRLNGADPRYPEELGGRWSLNDGQRDILAPHLPGTGVRARWGVGYAEWLATGGGLRLLRRVWAPFGEIPALRIDVKVNAEYGGLLPAVTHMEHWGFIPYPLFPGVLMSPRTRAPRKHPLAYRPFWYAFFSISSLSRALTEALRRTLCVHHKLAGRFHRDINAVVLAPEILAKPERTSVNPRLNGAVFLAALPVAPVTGSLLERRGAPVARLDHQLDPDSRQASFSMAVGVAPVEQVPRIIAAMEKTTPAESAEAWRDVLSTSLPGAPALEREARWHSYYLRGAKVRDDSFGCSYVPQGSAYGYVHGVQGTPRDYAISSVPLTYVDPSGSKEMLRLVMRMTRPCGTIFYSHVGSGVCTSGVVHNAPTDLSLFFLWALTEYVWATGDFDFLDEEVPFYSGLGRRRRSSSVRDRALLAWRYTRDSVGVGPHGMLRVGSGDWSDPISLMVSDRLAFRRQGESAFNTALAAFALPRAAELLGATHPDEASAMRTFAGRLRDAMDEAWCGRWFYRGWDGRGNPIGARHLFLDSAVWCLIARLGDEERRRTLVRAIDELCDSPSPIGATVLDRPHYIRLGLLPRGWDCNGGVWSAICGLLAWGYSLHDPVLAWRCLEKQSLSAHARAYPDVWFGIWSGPDSYNAHYADRPGETFIQPATPMQEFPVMNSNAHAGPLLGLLKVLGVEAATEGIRVEPRLPEGFGPWRLATPVLNVESDGHGATVT